MLISVPLQYQGALQRSSPAWGACLCGHHRGRDDASLNSADSAHAPWKPDDLITSVPKHHPGTLGSQGQQYSLSSVSGTDKKTEKLCRAFWDVLVSSLVCPSLLVSEVTVEHITLFLVSATVPHSRGHHLDASSPELRRERGKE